MTRQEAEALIERAIGLLDALDAPGEDREPEEDCCEAGDDAPLAHGYGVRGAETFTTGDHEDAEEDDAGGDTSDDEPGRVPCHYGPAECMPLRQSS